MKKFLPLLLPIILSLSSCVAVDDAATRLRPVGRGIRDGLAQVGQHSRNGFAWIESRIQERAKQHKSSPRRSFSPAPASVWSNTSSSNSHPRTTYASSGESVAKPKPPVSKPPSSWSQGPVPSSGSSRSTAESSSSKKETSVPMSKESKEFGDLPFAVAVPGKSGYVTLPSRNLPEIDVRGIAPGTPVEIQDPERAGETIQFKVP